jgi:SulP family sulfate permease
MTDEPPQHPSPEGLHRLLPALTWLPTYRPALLRADVIAGLTLGAYLLPAGIGDASLAQLPPESGLYACMLGGLVFWALCSSRRTVVTVTSAISLLIGAALGEIAGGDPVRFAALASCTALLVAMLALGAWLLRAGSLVTFISETVLLGFKAGVALTLASTQIPKLLGIHSAHGDFWDNAAHIAHELHATNLAALTVGLAALAVLILGKRFLKNKPVAIVVVVGGIIAAGALGLSDKGVKLLGEVPQGLPPIGVPSLTRADIREIFPLAMACFLLAAVETTAIGRMFGAKHGERLDANQELLAIAGANLASGLGHGFPISGGMSQSLINESAGARTPISGLIGAALILVVVLFFSDALRDLPQPALAAIVLMAVTSLFNMRAFARLWRHDRQEFLIAVAALAGVLATGLLQGVLIGAVISLLLLIRRASRPHVAFLGKIPGSRRYSDHDRHPDNELHEDLLIFRPEGSLVYFNADHIRDTVLARVREMPRPPLRRRLRPVRFSAARPGRRRDARRHGHRAEVHGNPPPDRGGPQLGARSAPPVRDRGIDRHHQSLHVRRRRRR